MGASCRCSESGFVIAVANLPIGNHAIDSGDNDDGAAITVGGCSQAVMASNGSDVRFARAKLQPDSILAMVLSRGSGGVRNRDYFAYTRASPSLRVIQDRSAKS